VLGRDFDVNMVFAVIDVAIFEADIGEAQLAVEVRQIVLESSRGSKSILPPSMNEPRYNQGMNVELTPDQRAFVQRAIESGRFSREEDAVEEALKFWEKRERRRLEIIAMVEEAEASLARGEGREITKASMKALAEDVKQRGRQRLAAEHAKSS
jgi:putative addiction module CopG family antidote